MKTQKIDIDLSSMILDAKYKSDKSIRVKWQIHHNYYMRYYDNAYMLEQPNYENL